MICEALSDRMPAVAKGEAEWDAEEAAHFSSCADCQAEWAVVAPIARAAGPAPTLDLDRLAAAVVAAARSEAKVIPIASRPRWTRPLIGLAAAAAVALAVWTQRPIAPSEEIAVVPTRVRTAIPELDVLLVEELKVVLASMDEDSTAFVPGPLPRLGDLTETELQQLLQTVEG